MTDLELRHYGVKGMKWGVRKTTQTDGSLSRKKNNKKDKAQDKKQDKKKKRQEIKGSSSYSFWTKFRTTEYHTTAIGYPTIHAVVFYGINKGSYKC